MKKLMFAIFPWLLVFLGKEAVAQKPDTKEEVQEIIIKKKGDKNTTLTLKFSGDEITVNGKPLIEFKDDDGITINKRKIVIGKNFRGFDMDNFMDDLNFNFDFDGNKATMQRPFLGVSYEKADKGVKITAVTPKSSADSAGLKKDDIITEIDNKKIITEQELSETIAAHKVGDKVKIEYLRDGKKKSTNAILGANKSMSRFRFNAPSAPAVPGQPRIYSMPNVPDMPDMQLFGDRMDNRQQKLGITITDLAKGKGVKISDVEDESVGKNSGLKVDDIIVDMNGKSIDNTDDARNALRSNRSNPNYDVKIMRDGKPMTINVDFPKKLKTIDL